MFFVASKVVWFLLTPSNVLVGLVLLGAGLSFTRLFRLGRVLALVGGIGLLVAGLTPLPNALMLTLENRFPPPDLAEVDDVGAIIVLGGATSASVTTARDVVALNEAAERLAVVPALAVRFPAAPIVLSGGSGALVGKTDADADRMADILAGMGVDRARMIAEPNARNTAENATETFRLVPPEAGRRYLLVTSAFHMPRAVGAFARAGWTGIVPYPVDFRTGGPEDVLRPMASVASGLKRTDTAVREWVGLIAYRLTGRTDALYPAPDGRRSW